MDAFFLYQNELVNRNKALYSEYPTLKWMNPYNAAEFQQIRNELLKHHNIQFRFKETKPFYKSLSPGCNICGQGKWSCLFIAGTCNANCFYCPAPQNDDGDPMSQGLAFPTPESYAEYVNKLGFKGVSFSGGEPLLYPDRVLSYLKAVRKMCHPDTYVWMYTNGILANREILKALGEAGLNEVRFDIGATGYRLDKIEMAKGIIPNITIEIPAVPEEKELLIKLLPEMIEAGVTNLNLHQLRLTKHNVAKLSTRDYTYIAAEKSVVLESELAALEIVNFAAKHQLEIGINYCSFFFKNRFQSAGLRRAIARTFGEKNALVTENGFVRKENAGKLEYHTLLLADEGVLPKPAQRISLEHKSYELYDEIALCREIDDNNATEIKALLQGEPETIPDTEPLFSIWKQEYIEKGLREY